MLNRNEFTSHQVDVGYACFGIDINQQGICINAAPIAHWMIGKNINDIKRWIKSKNGKIDGEDLI